MIYSFKIFESFADKDYISIGRVSSDLLPHDQQDLNSLMSSISLIKFEKIDDQFRHDLFNITKDIKPIKFAVHEQTTARYWRMNPEYMQYNMPEYFSQMTIYTTSEINGFSLCISKLKDEYALVFLYDGSWSCYICDISSDYVGYRNLIHDLF